ncbi:hypothetical protein RND81_13G211000 [Saponaria officinalis]|uniref:Uncharacterized protein n=1 Tax=Saponaria officinalis TaxID=3572 RepID=A0AAW1H358_SAPOF
MAQPQNFEHPDFPFAPPHAFPSPPNEPPPFHPVAPPFAHPPPFPSPAPPKPLNPPPSPMPKPPPHQLSPPMPKPPSPPPPIPKPPPHRFSPPPPSPKLPPPHPHHPPPPPHVMPTPPLPPSPTPGHHSTVIIVVFVSVGGLFFLAFLAAALFCYVKKRKRTIKEIDNYDFDEKMKVKEEIVRGPHGEQAVLVTFEEDIHAHETKIKDEIVGEASHTRLAHESQSLDAAPANLGTAHHHSESRASGTT